MMRTYRVLGVVALVALVVAALHVVYLHWWYTRHTPVDGALFFLQVFVPLTTSLIAITVSAFAVVVAGQSRAWIWLLTFLVVGLFSWYGAPTLVLVLLRSAPQHDATLSLAVYVYGQPILEAIPALLALVFVWLRLRANSSAPNALAS